MFSDQFMQKSIHHHPSCMNSRLYHDCTSSSKGTAPVFIPKRKSAPNTIIRDVKQEHSPQTERGLSLLRQQSLPPTSHCSSRHTKHIARKLLLSHSASHSEGNSVSMKPSFYQRQQSIPSKGSPKPPLLDRTHTVPSVPAVITKTRVYRHLAQSNNAPIQTCSNGRRSLPSVDHKSRSAFEEPKTRRVHRVRGRSVDVHLKTTSSRLLVDCLPHSLSASQVSREHSSSCGVGNSSAKGQIRVSSQKLGDLEAKVSAAHHCFSASDDDSDEDEDKDEDEDDILSSDLDDQGLVFEEELTDLEDNEGDLHYSENDDDEIHKCDWSDPVTCISETGSYVTGEVYHGIKLVAEVERRRERDFGSNRSPVSALSMMSSYRHKSLCSSSKGDSISDTKGEIHLKSEKKFPLHPVTIPRTQGQSSLCSSLTVSAPLTPRGTDQPSSALRPSIFPKQLPPTIHFPLPDENYVPLPKNKRALLKWKMSSITPNIVKHCVARAGFSKWSKGSVWIGYWGKHMKEQSFKTVKDYQKVNHFPGTFQIGRKDRLWKNLSRMQIRVGRRECDFVPQTFVLPQDLHHLKKEWDNGPQKQKWILKPPAAARGIGVRLISRWSQIPKKRPIVVQRYISDPYLINGSKFDLRVYVYVSSYDPLKVYVFREGLVRFATTKYSSAMKHLSNKFMHLTNYSINKHNIDFTPNADETVCQGHKWGLLALWHYMETQLGLNTTEIWQSIKDVVVKTIVCSEPYVSSCVKAFVRNSDSVHELFGFDIMLDRHLKPWLLEVNISPSLHSNSQLDINIKGRLVRDLFNIAGFTLPDFSGECSHLRPRHTLSTSERIKDERCKILDSLTPHDVLTIMKSEDELLRSGHFERVFPTPCYERYRKFFETERYNNILLCEWAARYQKCPRKGHLLLNRQSLVE